MTDKQQTIANPISVSGTGLHTGVTVTLTFKPAPENSGIRFQRIDLDGQPVIPANCDHVLDTNRGTTIGLNGASVATVEHVMAALKGMQIDNALIEIDNDETPIIDGSARYFSEALQKAGTVEQNAQREVFELDTVLTYSDPKNKVELIAVPAEEFKLTVMIDFETEVLSTQNASLESIQNFNEEISMCRTFVFLHELEYLLSNDRIKGGDLSNAIVFVNRAISQEELDRLAKLFNKPSVKVLDKGILNNIELHYENEPARHKLLDVVGDLSLTGFGLKAHIIAKRPGHGANVEFAKIIKQYKVDQEINNFEPPFDIIKTPLFDINDIKKLLPHRPPFLLIDKIMDMDDARVVGVKNVTMNETFFEGHFPDEPVMPGVLQIEAMAQTGGILILNSIEEPQNYLTYFLKIENVKFRNKVVPGDTIVFSLKLVSPIRRGLCHMKGIGYVANKPVIEAEMLAQISKKTNV
ncbi:MAG TPA: bifunctional UDP-3-O-[3-hydroxymyristoyl] N-acetylglucosamine deacetylase/3-hydroxyacyl-ACP dehydratase [Bacteroidales bacterium]|nr:bifunctional UDP-3-O-[3-hydroxymyristoyl] N-acetylglucosamine deacetylase/3-hydroxyacyl-ACP dehydratase [Bacteroidales bacterium]HPE57219.1 bifunctional UDP-3-O-[3-hydroxymyristoyl] N-acetylglucosamine deacetylase/3-hydroxyacyl-ACP dehydratase [Bacteroidales bacterium]HRX97678.1 bifunctional UDP-3-O-[3-hydroxymyristoyl] N-acetylglucosamine deacetylase/3-hydroxyacyl-ACP dehydratase [Bacteroidales bacterium]